ncbi:Csu type fimbrial protein [Yokenella regensburgei]|uniref:Csu type fimbrial protein n=1 Tax=Yokenella regensburgei TaxID=158877 RepID=UPI0020772DBC|nr:spore coat protein U domain-containing protein [Yokenella regensburgei]
MRLKLWLLLAALLLSPGISHAVTCSLSNVSPVNFAAVNPLATTGPATSMTFNYSCAKELGDVLAGINLCFNIGNSGVSGAIATRTMSSAGPPASTLNYQLYQNAGNTVVWGSQYQTGTTFPMVQLTLLNLTPVTGSLTVYAQVPTPQSAPVPGAFQDSYTASTALVTLNVGLLAPPTTCGTTVAATFPFNVTATVVKQCNVSYANNVSFGSVTASQSNITSFNTLGVACTSNTPYTIGLVPSNSNTAGSGAMKGTGSNTDTVPYQLSSTAGPSGTVWGNTAQNTVAGTGTGSTVAYTVYGTVPSANYTPDSYSDTVTINVTY